MKFKILVVDDDAGLRLLLRQMLEFRGFVVVEAETGEEALQLVTQDVPDAIVLDVMMPGIDGLEVCRRVRSQPETAALPIVILSGKVHAEAIKAGMAAGATKYLCKPIAMSDLIDEIRDVLSISVSDELSTN